MGFFSRGDEPDQPYRHDLPSQVTLPQDAQARLAQLSGGLFTSTLSANELALLTELGPKPLGQVLGACVHQVGWQYLPAQARAGDFVWQLEMVSQAWGSARQLAFARMLQEAATIGADAVVAVKLQRAKSYWAKRTVDFTVSGTGVRLPDAARGEQGQPLLTDLSVQDYWKLARGGWAPAGLVAASSAVFVSQGAGTRFRRQRSMLRNQELIEFSDGFQTARRAAIADLQQQASRSGAEGIVGVSFEYEISSGKFEVATTRERPSEMKTSTIGPGVSLQMGGADKRSGFVFTVHAIGTGIRAQTGQPTGATTAFINLGGIS